MDLGAFLETVEITLPSLAGFSPPGQNAFGKAMVQRMLLSDDDKSTDDVEHLLFFCFSVVRLFHVVYL
jgi:hypothetical protein